MAGDEFDDIPLGPRSNSTPTRSATTTATRWSTRRSEWIEAKDHESLDERLSEETPDVSPESIDPRDADDGSPAVESMSDSDIDHLDPEQHGRERGQIDGTPEDGDSFFVVVD